MTSRANDAGARRWVGVGHATSPGAPAAPIGGFYTHGEIARIRGSRGLHTATLVLMALA